MRRTIILAMLAAAAGLLPAASARADRALPMRTVDCYMFKRLPAMKLVVRNQQTLTAMCATGLVDIDFTREMGLFVSLGMEQQNLEGLAIKRVTEADDRITVETQTFTFEQLLESEEEISAHHFVIVPKSDKPVEGFTEKIKPSKGLCAVSSLVAVAHETEFKDILEKAKARGYDARRVREDNPMIERLGWLDSVCWDAGPDADPRSVTVRFKSTKGGGGAICEVEILRWVGPKPKKERGKPLIRCPADEMRVILGIEAAYGLPRVFSERAARQVIELYGVKMESGRHDIAAIRKSEINPERFRKFVQAEGKTFVTAGGNFIDQIDEIGKTGSLRWKKPYIKAERDVDGLGHVVMGFNELNLFQIRIEEVQTTDVDELRKETQRQARRVGVRMSDEAAEKMIFTFHVEQRM